MRRSAPPSRRHTPSATPLTSGELPTHLCDGAARFGRAGAVLLLCDFACLAAAAWVSTTLHPPLATAATAISPARAAWMAAVLAPFVLYDRRFGSRPLQLGSHALRFALFAALTLLLGAIGQILQAAPPALLVLFFALGFLSTSLTRVVMARCMLHLQRHGPLTEVVAIVGAGPLADRLAQQLRRLRPDTTEVLGVFDDTPHAAADGSVSQLIELGSTRRIDWIVLTLPPGTELNALVQRLMALAVPITSCPQQLGLALDRPVGYLAGSIPVTLLAEPPMPERDAYLHAMEEFVPRWVVTWMRLALDAAGELAERYALRTAGKDGPPLVLSLLDHDVTALFCLCGHARRRRGAAPERVPEVARTLRNSRPRTIRPPLTLSPAARDPRPAPATLPRQ